MAEGIFWELHADLPQQAPGSDPTTLRLLEGRLPLPEDARVLDVGCGPGRQTLVLARATDAHVVAVDLQKPFLDTLLARAREEGLAERIETRACSMADLEFPDASFDLIWSEGAIYVMGFEAGLRAWRRLLRPGGHLVVSELSWLTDDPPAEPTEFWREGYPGMRTVEANLAAARDAGYRVVDHAVLPERDWWDGYYTPLMARSEALKKKYADDPDALENIDAGVRECALYRRYAAAYGYVFYVLAAD